MARRLKDKTQFEFRPYEGTKRKDKHVRITDSMMTSKAWLSLTIHSRYLYIEFKRRYHFTNADDVSFTYVEAKEIMNVNTFSKSVKELINKGFLYYVRHSPNTRQCNIYGLSDKWSK